MTHQKYPVHGEPGCAWFLVFDVAAANWVIEEVRADRAHKRTRVPLADFERSALGQQLAGKLREAMARADSDHPNENT